MRNATIGVMFVLSLTLGCKATTDDGTYVNFSFSVCPSVLVMNVTPIFEEDGRISANINCTSSQLLLQKDLALVFHTDGNISLAPVEKDIVNIKREEHILQTVSIMHKDGGIVLYRGKPGSLRDMVIFEERVTVADVSLVAWVPHNNFLYEFFETAFDSILENPRGVIEKKSTIFISSFLSTRTLSNIPFLIFDEVSILSQINYKLSDLTISIPADVLSALQQEERKVKVHPGFSLGDLELLSPIFVFLPDISAHSIKKIAGRENSYLVDLNEGQAIIPVYLTNLNKKSEIDIFATVRDHILFGKMENVTQTSVFMNVLPPTEDDVESFLNFSFADHVSEIWFSVYSRKGGVNLHVLSGTTSRGSRRQKIRIPKILLADEYLMRMYLERTEVRDMVKIVERFERYEVSREPFVQYDAVFFRPDDFLFEASVEENILLSWKIPFMIRADDLYALPPQRCLRVIAGGNFLTRDCISAYIEIFGRDERNNYVVLWRIYNLDRKDRIKFPNILTNKDLLFEIIGAVPNIKIEEISLMYTAFFEGTIVKYSKSFRYDL